MAKLKLEIGQYRELVVGRVVEQDEALRGKELVLKCVGINIKSFEKPQLDADSLYIRGSGIGNDNETFHYQALDGVAAYALINRIRSAVSKLNSQQDESAVMGAHIKLEIVE